MTEFEKMIHGEWYDTSDPELVSQRNKARNVSERYNQTKEEQVTERKALLQELLGAYGEGCEIYPTVKFDYGCNTYIGAHTYINFNAVFLDCAQIHIGSNVLIGPNCSFLTPVHPMLARERNMRIAKDGHTYMIESRKPIVIGDNCWFGGNVTVMPGVTVGHDTVIGAGSVITKDIPSGVVAVGNPCRVLREITEEDAIGI